MELLLLTKKVLHHSGLHHLYACTFWALLPLLGQICVECCTSYDLLCLFVVGEGVLYDQRCYFLVIVLESLWTEEPGSDLRPPQQLLCCINLSSFLGTRVVKYGLVSDQAPWIT